MMKIYYFVVRLGYVLTWPLSGLFLHNSHRVRVLVVRGDKILLVKNSYGTKRWSLPGGGIERGESCMSAAVRELAEETKIDIEKSALTLLGTARVSGRIKYPAINNTYFVARVPEHIQEKIVRPLEIQKLAWFSPRKLPADVSKSVQIALKMNKLNSES